MIAIKQILVATDFSEASEAALRYGKAFARMHNAVLHVLHIMDDLTVRLSTPAEPIVPNVDRLQADMDHEAHRAISALLTPDDRRRLKTVTAVVRSTRPAEEIVTYAEDHAIDLVIVGTHGRTGLAAFFMGSVAQQIVRSAPCPVLTVRHPERDFIRPDALPVHASI